MDKRRLLAVCVVLLLCSLGAAPQDDDWPSNHYRAVAVFRQTDPANFCMETTVRVTAEEVRYPGFGRVQQALVYVSERDVCEEDDAGLLAAYYGVKRLTPAEFGIDRRLTRTWLNTRVRACNLLNTADCLNLQVRLRWTSAGPLTIAYGLGTRAAHLTGAIYNGSVSLTPEPALQAWMDKER